MSHEIYMHRCLQLAKLAEGNVAPNPMVGAVLVYDERIMGEGYHQKYGEAHAEVACVASVKEEDRHLIDQSTLYVSLEPCAHFGKTPPCANMILNNKIPKVVVGCRDPFREVNGKGTEKLQTAGVEVLVGILEKECWELNRRFFTFHTQHRPYVILKWAQTGDAKIANEDYSRVFISNEYTNRMVHKWRSEEMAILVGTNTALFDDPELTTRLWPGNNSIRLVVDMHLRLPGTLKLFQSGHPTIIFNLHKHSLPFEKMSIADLKNSGVNYYQVTDDVSLVHQISNALYQLNIQSVMVEGGAILLQSFINEEVWDEARVIRNEGLILNNGLRAPVLNNHTVSSIQNVQSDIIQIFVQKI